LRQLIFKKTKKNTLSPLRLFVPNKLDQIGLFLGMLIGTFSYLYYYGSTISINLSYIPNSILIVIAAMVGVIILGLLINLLISWIKKLSLQLPGWILSNLIIITFLLVFFGLNPRYALLTSTVITLIGGIMGFSAGWIIGYLRNKDRGTIGYPLSVAFIIVGITLTSIFCYWLYFPGFNNYKVHSIPSITLAQNSFPLKDPSIPGNFPVYRISYDSYWEKEYVNSLTTQSVDISKLLPKSNGIKAIARENYWSFKSTNVPIKGDVWYPGGEGQYPIVFIVHGNYSMVKPSEQGYGYIGELLASHGFIVVSIDENFLNGSWLGGYNGKEIPARAYVLLMHMKQWEVWSKEPNNPFYGKIDLDNIAIIGHSRGGEAAVTAAVFNDLKYLPENSSIALDFNYNIKSIISLSPTEGRYLPSGRSKELSDVNYLLLYGSHDSDISTFRSIRQYQRIKFSGDDYRVKSAVYIYRGNHNQFNTLWGRRDLPLPIGLLLNTNNLLQVEEQQHIAKVLVTSFLKGTLYGDDKYLRIFSENQTPGWMSEMVFKKRFSDSSTINICDYEEDIDLTTTTLGGTISSEGINNWREGPLPLRKGVENQLNNVVFLSWNSNNNQNQSIEYTIEIPKEVKEQLNIGLNDQLVFSCMNLGNEEVDFSIKLSDIKGNVSLIPISHFSIVTPPFVVKTTKAPYLESKITKDYEYFLETISIPIESFLDYNKELSIENINTVSIVFSRTPKGKIALDEIAIRKGVK
jgi:dienelactone hydrolase